MHTFIVTGALITPVSGRNTHPFREHVEAVNREAAFAIVHGRLSARLDPTGEGEGDVYNFYVNTTGSKWYGWEPDAEDTI